MAMVKCRECGFGVSSAAATCPHCGIRRPAGGLQLTGLQLGCGIPVVLVLMAIGFAADTRDREQTAAELAREEESRIAGEVRFACQTWVRGRLKAPATAKFVRSTVETGRLIGGDSTQWVSRGAVDAQNSFGALLRNQYKCVARVRGSEISAVSVTVE